MQFQEPRSHIHIIARGLLFHGESVVLCRVKGAEWFFLPGGHVEDGESVKGALLRELHEEIGGNDYVIRSFVGVCENIFLFKEGVLQHEMNIIFEVNVPADIVPKTKEDHIEFVSINKNDLKNCIILPSNLKDGIIEWTYSNKAFFKEL